MLEALRQYLAGVSAAQLARDGIDIFVVYLVVYGILRVVRGTRAMQVGVGIAFVFVLYVVAKAVQLVTVLSILDSLLASFILVLVVVFQNDIRRGLMRVGSRGQGLFALRRTKEAEMIDEVVEACTELARHRTGAIIAFERDANLDEFVGVHKGHVVDAAVSAEMLVALFLPEAMNKLHDGAVVIRDLRIAKAGVFFPMPDVRPLDESFGSRHRAALGITEETDAVVVVVSEERGTISFCFNGNIIPGLDGPNLRKALEDFFAPKARKKKAPASARRTGITPPPPTSEPRISTVEDDSATIPRLPPVETDEAEPAPLRPTRSSTAPPAASEPPAPLRPSRAAVAGDERSPKPPAVRSDPPPPLRPRAQSDPEGPKSSRTRIAPTATPLRPDTSRRRRTAPGDASRTSGTDDEEAQSGAGGKGEPS